jgi:thymidylate kinase
VLKNKNVNKIIIEGPDLSGKSTLLDRLKNRLRWDGKSLHHKEGDQFKRYCREYALAEEVVFNRGHISEEVYSQLWRGGNPFIKEEKNILNSLLRHNSIIIFACPCLEVMRERYLERNFEQQIKIDELQKSRELFIKIMDELPNIRYYSSSYNELDLIIERVYREVIV